MSERGHGYREDYDSIPAPPPTKTVLAVGRISRQHAGVRFQSTIHRNYTTEDGSTTICTWRCPGYHDTTNRHTISHDEQRMADRRMRKVYGDITKRIASSG